MKFIWDAEGMAIGNIILDAVILAVAFGLLLTLFLVVVRRKAPLILLIGSYAVLVLGFICNSFATLLVGGFAVLIVVIISLFINIGDLRKFIANPFKRTGAKAGTVKIEKVFDRKTTYKIIEQTVIALSKDRIGALMTFEKNTSLADIIKNGVPVHAPLTAELLCTIFYPGTRLHDGAVVIHNNEIIAASVFFTPTTKAFAGKYGSRHRAAIGISEICDAVTVVVSEETGRISFAVNGQLESVDQTNFLRVFENYMDGTNED